MSAAYNVHGLPGDACDPYPSPAYDAAPEHTHDYRRSQYLTEVLDRLSDEEIRELARTLGNLCPRIFEHELESIQKIRVWRAARA